MSEPIAYIVLSVLTFVTRLHWRKKTESKYTIIAHIICVMADGEHGRVSTFLKSRTFTERLRPLLNHVLVGGFRQIARVRKNAK